MMPSDIFGPSSRAVPERIEGPSPVHFRNDESMNPVRSKVSTIDLGLCQIAKSLTGPYYHVAECAEEN
jgi:hypothetical protein